MADPLTPEQLAAIRQHAERQYLPVGERLSDQSPDPEPGLVELETLICEVVPALLAEVERLRAELAEIRAVLIRELRASYRFRKAWQSARRRAREYRIGFHNYRKAVDEADAARDRLAEQVKRVRAIHQRRDDPSGPVCGACLDAREQPVDWPCDTIRALDGEEAAPVEALRQALPEARSR